MGRTGAEELRNTARVVGVNTEEFWLTAARIAAEGGSRVELITWHERQAELLEGQADTHRWSAAKLIAEEVAAGTTERKLAELIGKSKTHVNRVKRCWLAFGHLGDQERPTWNQAYHSSAVRGREKELSVPTVEKLIETFMEDPHLAELFKSAIRQAEEASREDDPKKLARARVQDKKRVATQAFSGMMRHLTLFLENVQIEDQAAAEKLIAALRDAMERLMQRAGEL